MIINFKYHIASLVAVFLALGIGILIGTTLLGNDTLTKTQDKMINDLRKNYDKIVAENKEYLSDVKKVQTSLNTRQDYEKKTLPLLVQNKLQNKQIAIIETNTSGARDDLINTLTKISGATITSDTTILTGSNIEQQKLDKIVNEFKIPGKDKEEQIKEISKQIVQNIITGQNKKLIEVLTKDNLLKVSGNYGVPISAVIIIGGSLDDKSNKVDLIDTPVITTLNEQKINVYGVETSDVPVSYMKPYQKLKITTVDDIDLIPGQVALVWTIEKQIIGDFGVKSTAKELLPVIQ